MRLGINFNSFLYLNKFMPLSSYSIQHLQSLAELENVDAFTMHYGSKYQLLTKRESLLLNALSFKFTNIQTPIFEESYKEISDTKPNMITFNNGLNDETLETEAASISEHSALLESATEWIKRHNILCAIKLKPEISEVKLASKFAFDYIEFDLSDLNRATNVDEETHEYEKLKVACIAAEKYGFGINAGGLVTTENISNIENCNIEEIYTGKHFFERSIVKGFIQTIEEYKKTVK